jgi:hypothetical protein
MTADTVLDTLDFPTVVKIERPDPLHGVIPRLWTKEELAGWAQCSESFLEKEIREKRLKAIRLSSGRVRFEWSDIRRWLEDV